MPPGPTLRNDPQTTPIEAVRAFEKRHQITLPESYIVAVTQHGWTGSWSSEFPLSSPAEWCQPEDTEDQPADSIPDLSTSFDPSYQGPGPIPGAMRIVNMGCDYYYLLVVSGPHSGEIWADRRVDNVPAAPLQKGSRTAEFSDIFEAGRWKLGCEAYDPVLKPFSLYRPSWLKFLRLITFW